MRKLILALFLISSAAQAQPVSAIEKSTTEFWKGKAPDRTATLGAMLGLGIYDGSAGFQISPNAAFKVAHEGWLEDINDQLLLELQMGPLFVKSSSVFTYSIHLRWDFERDVNWTFYPIGGLGGSISSKTLGSQWRLAPRFGLGAFWRFHPKFHARFEVTHDFIGTGVSVEL
jgi:hypothetical protein